MIKLIVEPIIIPLYVDRDVKEYHIVVESKKELTVKRYLNELLDTRYYQLDNLYKEHGSRNGYSFTTREKCQKFLDDVIEPKRTMACLAGFDDSWVEEYK